MELCNLFSSPNIVVVEKYRKLWLSRHVERDGKDNESIQMLGRDIPGSSVNWTARSGSKYKTELGAEGWGLWGAVDGYKPWSVADNRSDYINHLA
jgi:hypothetical protein